MPRQPAVRLSLTLAAACFLLLSGVSGWAQKAPPKLDCEKAASTPEIAACAAEDLKEADTDLNAVYRKALASIGQAGHLNTNQRRDWERALREAQRHWLAFRDKDYGEVVSWEWFQGTGMATAGLACKAQKTRTRTEELKVRYFG